MTSAGDVAVQDALAELAALALPGGGFPARAKAAFDPASTAWAAMALLGVDDALADAALARLTDAQDADGAVRLSPDHPDAIWPTYPALLAFSARSARRPQAARAAAFLLRLSGKSWPRQTDAATAHDTSLRGWPWIAGTHSWVEPTALALLSLKAASRATPPDDAEGRDRSVGVPFGRPARAGRPDLLNHSGRPWLPSHPGLPGRPSLVSRPGLVGRPGLPGLDGRTDEAIRLLLDRQLSSGGWNYGNTVVFGAEQLPGPDSAGLALAALAGSVPVPAVARSLDYLRRTLPGLLAPLSLSWTLLGLRAWDAEPSGAREAVSFSLARRDRYGGYDTTLLSLLALSWRARAGLPEFLRQAGAETWT